MDSLFPGFERRSIDTGDAQITVRIGGTGRPVLLLHGHPQTHVIGTGSLPGSPSAIRWSRPISAATVTPPSRAVRSITATTRSGRWRSTSSPVMRSLGLGAFDVIAHDRGARVAHRLALDHPKAVRRLVLLDVAPTLAMYEQTTEAFARAYWHWFFLIQPAPLPERLIEADPTAYVRDIMTPVGRAGAVRPPGARGVPALPGPPGDGARAVRGLPRLGWHRPRSRLRRP